MENKVNELKAWLDSNGFRLEVGKSYGGLYLCHKSGAYALLETDDENVVQFEKPRMFDEMFYVFDKEFVNADNQ